MPIVFFLCAIATICKPWFYFQKTQLPTRPIRTKIRKKSKRRLRKTKWRFVLFVFLLRLIEKHKILSSKQKNIILLLLR